MIAQIFLDTNCLIHLRDIKDLPWKNIILNIKGIEINICQDVIDELDEIKIVVLGGSGTDPVWHYH